MGAGGLSSGHELQARARLLQSVWVACGRLVLYVGESWVEKRSALYWCGCMPLLPHTRLPSPCQPACSGLGLCMLPLIWRS